MTNIYPFLCSRPVLFLRSRVVCLARSHTEAILRIYFFRVKCSVKVADDEDPRLVRNLFYNRINFTLACIECTSTICASKMVGADNIVRIRDRWFEWQGWYGRTKGIRTQIRERTYTYMYMYLCRLDGAIFALRTPYFLSSDAFLSSSTLSLFSFLSAPSSRYSSR